MKVDMPLNKETKPCCCEMRIKVRCSKKKTKFQKLKKINYDYNNLHHLIKMVLETRKYPKLWRCVVA